ncbi:MAG: hypothetical protein SOS24_03750 [Clostridia bacterium]|nr:hypothetical protein [Clostridia bacterium]
MSIYSSEIPRICAYCVNAERAAEEADETVCRRDGKTVEITKEACRHYKYDILKRTVRRRKPFKTNLTQEDFSLE